MRPKIGVTSALGSALGDETPGREVERHIKLLESLGAQGVVLARGSPTADALEREELSGVLLSGGGDVAAERYGGRDSLCWDADLRRDEGELALVRAAFAQRVPALCVCRGLQVANVAFGGTLIEDLKNELGARYRIAHHQVRELEKEPSERTHDMHLDANSALAGILGTDHLPTNSMHHQAVRAVAPALRAVGWADDGIIEAIELAVPDFFFYGVQWHPESLPQNDASVRLYTAFVQAAINYRSTHERAGNVSRKGSTDFSAGEL